MKELQRQFPALGSDPVEGTTCTQVSPEGSQSLPVSGYY